MLITLKLQINFEKMNNHGPTRWTTLEKIIDKILNMWDAFGLEFADGSPAILHEFFVLSDTSFALCNFLSHVLSIFNKYIDELQVYFIIALKKFHF